MAYEKIKTFDPKLSKESFVNRKAIAKDDFVETPLIYYFDDYLCPQYREPKRSDPEVLPLKSEMWLMEEEAQA